MKTKDRRCPVCREVFTPNNGRQIVCTRCRPYYYVSGDCGPARSVENARALYLADMTAQGVKVSDWPAAPGCDGCGHWRGICGGSRTRACHYSLDTGEKRPCLPGRNCTVRTNEKIYDRTEANF